MLFHDQVFAADNSQKVFAVWFLHTDDLILFSCFGLEQINRNLTQLFECFSVENVNFINLCDNESIVLLQLKTNGAFQVLFYNRNHEIMLIPSPVNVKWLLILFVSNSIFDLRTKHHLITTHEVKHDVLQRWHEGLRINEIEVNLLICGNLNSLITFDEIDEASLIDFLI